jgi:hypothetical protein
MVLLCSVHRDFEFLLYTILNVSLTAASKTLDSAEALDATCNHLYNDCFRWVGRQRITPKGYFPVDCVASAFHVSSRAIMHAVGLPLREVGYISEL